MTSPRECITASLNRTISSNASDAETLCINIRNLLNETGLLRTPFTIELVARECLANAIVHGNKNDGAKSIALHLRIGRVWIRLCVKDEGDGFNSKDRQTDIYDTSSTSGRGLQLCWLYAERVRFNSRGNQITLWMKRTE
jgi:anti-sigma regulatory factor (Ser/Thr protein kinase)